MGTRTRRGVWLAAHRTRLLDSMAERQLNAVAVGKPGRPAPSAVGMWLLALPVNLLTAAFLGVGIGWLVVGPTGLRILAVLLLVAFLATAPRPDRRTLAGLTRERAPALFGVLDAIAAETGAPVPVRVQLDTRFNCAATRIRRRAVLVLGAPLWSALPPQARVAVLGHELGHLAHRDLLASRWVGWARESAWHWYDVGGSGISLNRRNARFSNRGSVGSVLTAVVLGGFRWLAAGYIWVMDAVNAASGRRREYLADLDAVRVGGTDGTLAAWDTLLTFDAVQAAMTRAALDPQKPDLWAAVVAATAADTAETRRRRRVLATEEKSRVDDSHPTTALRIRLVEQRPWSSAAVAPDSGTWARIDQELAPTMTALAARARDDVRYGRR